MKYTRYIYAITLLLSWLSIQPMDNPHFYRATNIFPEPRIEHDYLSSFDMTIGSGSTDKSRNSSHEIVPLLDICGTNTLTINNIPTQFSIHGTFKIIESNLSFTQNLAKGFLLFFHIPVRSLSIKHLSFTNLANKTQKDFACTVKNTLSEHTISIAPTQETGLGDLSTLAGWTHNYQNTKTLDFIDGTISTGILAPTGKKRNEQELFSLPLGYNGHWGIPLNAMLSIGTYEWITIGSYASALFFIKKNQSIRIKTSAENSGIIKLGLNNVSINKGTIWNTGLYFKADHFAYGLSFTAAYSYAGEQKTVLKPQNNVLDSAIINTDQTLKGWNMHTIHFFIEYDFAKQDSKFGPRIGAFYNKQINGARVFKTNVNGFSCGVDIGWDL